MEISWNIVSPEMWESCVLFIQKIVASFIQVQCFAHHQSSCPKYRRRRRSRRREHLKKKVVTVRKEIPVEKRLPKPPPQEMKSQVFYVKKSFEVIL